MACSSLLIFGGTFDPPHLAHTRLPPLVAKRLGADRIIYVPAAANPLKPNRPTPARHRLAMLRLAIASVPDAEIDSIELDRPGPSYTVETLEALRERYDDDVELRLLIGADQVPDFDRWREPQRILELATPAVLLRPPGDERAFRERLAGFFPPHLADRWVSWTVPVPPMDITATEIRRRLSAREDVSDLLDPVVADYIREHGLYGG